MKPHLVLLIVFASVMAVAVQAVAFLFVVTAVARHHAPAPRPMIVAGGGPAVVVPFQPVEAPREEVCAPQALPEMRGEMVPTRDYTFSGPFTHGNLTVFLIHGRDTMREQRVLPLHAALAQNQAVVHAGIAVDNLSQAPLFIHAGDIIKGGTQDRVIPYDQIIPIGARGRHLNVFCVEAGRSGPRGMETSTAFETATEQLPGRRLHLAARYRKSQQDVWQGVQDLQHALNRNLGGSVQAPLSPTSLQLTLETDRVQRAVQNALNELAPLPERHPKAIGFAVAVNGYVQSADVYASTDLFQDLWPKLLRAQVVAALADRQPAAAAPVTTELVRQFLADAESGATCRRDATSNTVVLRQESTRSLLFDTCDPARANLVVHRSFLAK